VSLAVEDRLALADLVHRYASYVDARDLDRVVALFTEDAVLVSPEPPRTLEPDVERRGRADVRQALEGVLRAVRTVHQIVGEVYDAGSTPDVAHGAITGVAHHLMEREGGHVDLSWSLRFADDYRRTPEGWRFARRALTIDVVESRPVGKVRP
jgi:ketosteroid isomerase-like protein